MRKPIVLITGATSGIGKATATLLAKHNFPLIINGRREEKLNKLSTELASVSEQPVLPLAFDIRKWLKCRNAVASLPEEWREIGVLINNAGKAKGKAPIHQGTIEHWEEMIDTNIRGLLYLTRLVSPGMVERRSGHIINVASSAGKEVYPEGNVYCATKFAVDALTKA